MEVYMDYTGKSLVELKAIAKERGLKRTSTMKKQELIDTLLADDKNNSAAPSENKVYETPSKSKKSDEVRETSAKSKKSDEVHEATSKPKKSDEVYEATSKPKKSDEIHEATLKSKKSDEVYEATLKSKKSDEVYEATSKSKKSDEVHEASVKPDSSHADKPVQRRNVPERHQNNYSSHQNNYNDHQDKRNNYNTGQSLQAAQNGQRSNNIAARNVSGINTEMQQLDSGEVKSGILEVMSDGYGFIRCDNYLPGEQDVYVSPALIRKFGLRTGDIIVGNTRIRNQNEKFSALLYMKSVNGYNPSVLAHRVKFEDLTPIFPNRRIHLETSGSGTAMRMMDLISPIGKGQRGMIVSQPKAGKTTLLKQVARAITKNHPEMHLIILLIDERPEEVTDIKESIEGKHVEVIYSTFDELPENHKRVSEMVIERAKRLVEHGRDVMVLLDSITRLARAYNLTVQPSGRTLSGGLDPAALYMPKKFFGAARNMREGGSLTVLATALVDTGSRMDDVVFEEFKGTGNMELVLDRRLSEKRIFPAIDLPKSSTRRDDLLLTQSEMEASFLMRRAMNGMKSDEAVEQIINMFIRTKNNNEFIEMIKKVKIV